MHTTPNPFSGAPFLPADPTLLALESLADRLTGRGDSVGAWTIRGTIDGLLGQPDPTEGSFEDWAVAYRNARAEALILRGGSK